MSLGVAGARHLQALLGSLGRLARSPLSTLLTLLVIALALALPTSLRLFVSNAQLATGNFANAVDVSVYLKTDVPLAKAQQLAQAAGQRAEVAAVTVIAADKGLEDFRTYSGFGEALQALKENPLPHVLHVRPKAEDSSPRRSRRCAVTSAPGPRWIWCRSTPNGSCASTPFWRCCGGCC